MPHFGNVGVTVENSDCFMLQLRLAVTKKH